MLEWAGSSTPYRYLRRSRYILIGCFLSNQERRGRETGNRVQNPGEQT